MRWIKIGLGMSFLLGAWIVWAWNSVWNSTILADSLTRGLLVFLLIWGILPGFLVAGLGFYDYEKTAGQIGLYSLVFLVGSVYPWSRVSDYYPRPSSQTMDIILSNTAFSGEPFSLVFGVIFLILYSVIWVSVFSLRRQL